MDDQPKIFICKDGIRFEVTPGGLFYAPEESSGEKKHPCPDCRFCQWCADPRCHLCLHQEKPIRKGAEEFELV